MIKSPYKTKQQALILTYLKSIQGVHFTAEDVRQHFENKGVAIGIATIYRQLEKFVADGILQKYFIDEHSACCFEYSGENCNLDEAHFHLKCEKCGRLIHLECQDLEDLTQHLKTEHGFTINPYRTVLYGVCDECAKSTEEK